MPVYNAEPFLREAIDSVLSQDYLNWELLIVNDGSSDNSLSIAKTYEDQRIKVLTQPNRGVANARNSALKVMQGEFFCFLDADDVLTPGSLSLRLKCFHSNEICFADGGVEIYDSQMEVKEGTWTPEPVVNLLKSLVRIDGKCFFGPTWMVRNKLSVSYQFDEELTHGEDLLFCLSYAHLGEYSSTHEVILRYRRNAQSAMNNLVGLANGYALIQRKIDHLASQVPFLDKVIYTLKSRKVVFLSFIHSRQIRLAIKYLFLGRV